MYFYGNIEVQQRRTESDNQSAVAVPEQHQFFYAGRKTDEGIDGRGEQFRGAVWARLPVVAVEVSVVIYLSQICKRYDPFVPFGLETVNGNMHDSPDYGGVSRDSCKPVRL